MKRALMLSMAIVLGASAAMADHIGIYNDQVGTNCYTAVPAFAPFSVYVLHTISVGSRASQWKVSDTTGITQSGSVNLPAVQLSIGGPFTGLAMTYNGCQAPGTIPIVQLNYFGFPSPPPACGPTSRLEIIPDPTAGGIVKVTSCDFVDSPATGGVFYFGDSSCAAGGCSIVATEEKTWGQIKALYR